jgi:hypothetical protein
LRLSEANCDIELIHSPQDFSCYVSGIKKLNGDVVFLESVKIPLAFDTSNILDAHKSKNKINFSK